MVETVDGLGLGLGGVMVETVDGPREGHRPHLPPCDLRPEGVCCAILIGRGLSATHKPTVVWPAPAPSPSFSGLVHARLWGVPRRWPQWHTQAWGEGQGQGGQGAIEGGMRVRSQF